MSHYGPGPAGETLHVGTLAQCTNPDCGVRPRTAAATAARMRAKEDRMAAELRGRGWLVIAPEHAIEVERAARKSGALAGAPRA
jgi:hypothetical protein